MPRSKHKDKLKDLPIQKAQNHRLEDDDSAIVTAGPSDDAPPIKKQKIEQKIEKPASPIQKLQQQSIKKHSAPPKKWW